MPRGAADLLEIPAALWQRAEMTEALRDRDMGRVLRLVRQYAGASQTQLAIACGMTQGKISEIMRGLQHVTALEVFERTSKPGSVHMSEVLTLHQASHVP